MQEPGAGSRPRTAAAAQPARLDPCGLLTQAEIKAAVGSYGVIQLNAFKGSTPVMVQLMLMTSAPDQVRAALAKLMIAVLPKVK